MNSTFEIKGKTYEYDFLDADKLELYEGCMQSVFDKFSSADKTQWKSKSEEIRWCCKTVKETLSPLFSCDIEEVLPGNNYGDCMGAINAMAMACSHAQDDLNGNMNSIPGYNPVVKQNRAQRRANKKLNNRK